MKFLAIAVGKLAVLVTGKILKRGTSFPGKLALKLDKSLLKKIELPPKIVAVTGSSGKGSTSSILAHIYKEMGYKVVHNSSGANLTPGITTTLLEHCTLFGKIKEDICIFEVDERYTKFVFKDIKPSHVVVTNITRDQPPRQGNVDLVYEEIKKALPQGAHLILNGDDPYIQNFNLNNEYITTYYTLDKTQYSAPQSMFKNLNIVYCPKCNSKLNYEYYHFEALGKYACPNCDFRQPDSQYHITNVDYSNFEMTVNNQYKFKLQYDLLYSVYNTMAAFTTASVLGLDNNKISVAISNMYKDSKLYNHYIYHGKDVYVLNNKNENSTTFNQSLLFVTRFEGTKTIVIGWKEISRRYIYNDLSWLYDVDFEILKQCNVGKVICVGPNAYDIATRIKLAGFDRSQIAIFDTLTDSKNLVNDSDSKYVFGILNFDYVVPFKATFPAKEVQE